MVSITDSRDMNQQTPRAVLQSMGLQRAGHDLVTEQQQPDSVLLRIINKIIHIKCLPESSAHIKNSVNSSHHLLFMVEHSFGVLAKCSQPTAVFHS